MKNIKLIIIVLLSAFALTSCEDFLTDKPESVLTQVGFYTTPTRINQGILGCYAGMATIQTEEWLYTELRSDNTCQVRQVQVPLYVLIKLMCLRSAHHQVCHHYKPTGIKFSRTFQTSMQ